MRSHSCLLARFRSRALALTFALPLTLSLVLTPSSIAFAGDTSTAEHLFQQGFEAMKRNQYKEACEAFAGSNEADPSPGTQINLALCNEKQGKFASAWGWYRTASGLADQRGQKERADLARGEAVKLEPKLHKLVISVKFPTDGLTVSRNGAPVPHAVLGTDVPIDPGDYAIEVAAKGKKTWKQTVHIAPTPGVDRLEVPALEDAPAETSAAGSPGQDSGPVIPQRDGTFQRNFGFVVGGAGIVAGIVAIALEFLALREEDKSKSAADEAKKTPQTEENVKKLNDSATSHHDAAKGDQLGAIVVGAGAVVLIGVGITMVLTAPSGPAKAADLRKPKLVPILGSGTAGLGVSGTF